MLTIVMYHYVRDVAGGPFAGLKARTRAEFIAQLDFIAGRYRVLRMEEVLAALQGEGVLPPDAALLTFDDGYREHAEYVVPLLQERGWQGSFFPVANAVCRREVLPPNRVHFILASSAAPPEIVRVILRGIEAWRGEPALPSATELYQRWAVASRFDPAEVVFIKRMLQRVLPAPLRTSLLEDLFARHVTPDWRSFADELYLSAAQLATMRDAGMHIGVHGGSHPWLDDLSEPEQAAEIGAGLELLGQIGAPTAGWVMAYPYGAYDAITLKLLRRRGCGAALTTRVAVADIARDPRLGLPRLDTNDLPYAHGQTDIRSRAAAF